LAIGLSISVSRNRVREINLTPWAFGTGGHVERDDPAHGPSGDRGVGGPGSIRGAPPKQEIGRCAGKR